MVRAVTVATQRVAEHASAATVESESESYITTDGQSASLSWNNAAIWGL
jgi:hypothetical protein